MAVLLKAATIRLLVKGTWDRVMLGNKTAQGKGCPVSEHAVRQAACSFPTGSHHQAPVEVTGTADWQATMQNWAGSADLHSSCPSRPCRQSALGPWSWQA